MRRWLYLERGDLGRLGPFFALYVLLFAGFSLLEGVSMTLFRAIDDASRPAAYRWVAILNVLSMLAYLFVAERYGSVRTFHLILGGCAAAGLAGAAALAWAPDAKACNYALFAGREIAITQMLMHFGTFLQEYFTREELSRILPIVYAGGRVGGIVGGWALETFAEALGLPTLVTLFAASCVLGMLGIALIAARAAPTSRAADHLGDPGVAPPSAADGRDAEAEARASLLGFLRFVWKSPLLFWLTATSLTFMLGRWVLNFEYSSTFSREFADEAEMARFVGRFTQGAQWFSLFVQTMVVGRLIATIGLKGAHLVYGAFFAGAMFLCLGELTLTGAVVVRVVESELRFGLRNPINMLIANKFSKSLRIRVRAWTLGWIVPAAALVGSETLGLLMAAGWREAIPFVGAALGVLYLAASLGLIVSFQERQPDEPRT